jgi:phage tail-like protein
MPKGTKTPPDPWTGFHFYVETDGNDNISSAVFTEVSGLEVKFNVEHVSEGGVNNSKHILLGPVEFSEITLRNGLTTTNELWNWFEDTLMAAQKGSQFPRKNISIILVDESRRETMRWNFQGALPVKWTGPQLKFDQSVVMIQSLQLIHQGLISAVSSGGRRP